MTAQNLEAFMDEAERVCASHGYTPTNWRQMRQRYGTVYAIEKLVVSGELQSGFTRMKALNILEWSAEAAVLEFPNEFAPPVREAASWRLEQV